MLSINFLINIPTTFAEVFRVQSEGTYILGDDTSREEAREKALIHAKRNAIEKVGVYIESYTESHNFRVTEDEIKAIAAGKMKIKDKKTNFFIDGDHWICRVIIDAQVETNRSDIEDVINRRNNISQSPFQTGIAVLDYDNDRRAYNHHDDSYHNRMHGKYTGVKLYAQDMRPLCTLSAQDRIMTESGEVVYSINSFHHYKQKAIHQSPYGLGYHTTKINDPLLRSGDHPLEIPVLKTEVTVPFKVYTIYISDEDGEILKHNPSAKEALRRLMVDIIN